MTKIYLVWYYCYDDESFVAGVFDSIKKAKELKAKLDDELRTAYFSGSHGIDEHELNKEDSGKEATDDDTNAD